MKYFLSFLFGAACGVGGTLVWLRKGIKKELEKTREEALRSSEIPFTFGDETNPDNSEKSIRSDSEASQGHSERYIPQREREKVDYHNIVSAVKKGEKPSVGVPIMPREEPKVVDDVDVFVENNEVDEDDIVNLSEREEEYIEIDKDTFKNDKDGYEKDELIYYRGDRIMSTENGTIIATPAMLVGPSWEQYVGHYANRTAYVRNERLMTDYEIYVEDGLHSDEFGPYDDT